MRPRRPLRTAGPDARPPAAGRERRIRALPFLAALPAAIVMAGYAAAGSGQDGLDRIAGKVLFERLWVPAPASTDAADGLGPLFNERSCAACHAGPGLGATLADNGDGGIFTRGLVAKLGDAGGSADPVYGAQLQTRAVPGLAAEGTLTVASLGDGPLPVTLDLAAGPLAADTRVSYRMAQPLLDRGALEAVDADAVLARADPDDADGDGVSGRPHWIDTPDGPALGRYGWKADQPDLDRQIAHALALDMGLSSPLDPFPYGDCTAAQPDCLAAPNGRSGIGDGEELSRQMVSLIALYVRGLATRPPPPDPDGAALFAAAGCAACHVPELPAAAGGTVRVYSDLLLHDMGAGLDDGLGAAGAASSEWRTAPLAGLASGKGRRYLHDGRAATLAAAILAHGGEAAAARHRFAALPPPDRDRLIAFLEQL